MSQFDYDWIVVGSGFGGSVSALRWPKRATRSPCWSAASASPTRTSRSRPGTCAATSGRRGSACSGIFRARPVQGRRRGQRLRRRRRQPRLRQHALRPRRRSSSRTRSGPDLGRLGAGAGAPLRRGAADARRRRPRRERRPRRPAAARARRAARGRRHLPEDPGRDLLRQPGQDRPRSLLRRRGARPHRLHALRPLHGRLPARRQEHPGQELPLAGRAPRRRGRARTAP